MCLVTDTHTCSSCFIPADNNLIHRNHLQKQPYTAREQLKFLQLSIFLSLSFFSFTSVSFQPVYSPLFLFPSLRCAYFPMWCSKPLRCPSHFSLCLSLFSLYFTVCVSGGEGRRRILRKWMSERKRWTYLSHRLPHTHNTHLGVDTHKTFKM